MKSRKEKFYSIKLTTEALLNRISIFAGNDGYVDAKSIQDTCVNRLHLTEEKSREIAMNTTWGAWYCGIPGMTYSVFAGVYGRFQPKDAIPLFLLGYDAGLYDQKGNFRENLFHLLEKKYAIEDEDGEYIISKTKMKEFIEKEAQQPTRLMNATWSYQNFGITGNKDEFDIIFDKMISRYKKNNANLDEGYVNVRDLKLWYVNSKYVVNQIEREALPARCLA